MSEHKSPPPNLTFGWARAQLLGAFFNGAFLIALGLSIFLQSIERFIDLKVVKSPKLVLMVGCVGLALNIVSAVFLHEHGHGEEGHGHRHSHGYSHSRASEEADTPVIYAPNFSRRHQSHKHLNANLAPKGMDLGMLGVLIHVLGDALNNVGVIVTALIIWLTNSPARYYADPAVSLWIAIMILFSALPLTKRSGNILLESAPPGVDLADVQKDLESIPGVKGVHELHVWRLDQQKAIASAHVVVSEENLTSFMEVGQVVVECLHAYGIHSATLQPELIPHGSEAREGKNEDVVASGASSVVGSLGQRVAKCGLTCGSMCEPLMCRK